MSDRSCCDCFSEADRSFFDSLFNNFIRGGTAAVIIYTTFYLIDKTIKNSCEIEELISRLEKCEKNHESSQDS